MHFFLHILEKSSTFAAKLSINHRCARHEYRVYAYEENIYFVIYNSYWGPALGGKHRRMDKQAM